jgi:predicted ATP-dependent endonuclease of OLD family
VNIVFDFLLRNPSDCIVFFDEPELHLHPELSYKLLQTLSSIGKNNQFVFCTHSPEIITASIENSVVVRYAKESR